jgi:hypothetical protein
MIMVLAPLKQPQKAVKPAKRTRDAEGADAADAAEDTVGESAD